MKFLPIILTALLLPSSVLAQSQVGVFADPSGNFCIVEDRPGPQTLYVLQKFTLGSTATRFQIEFSPGFAGTLLSVSVPNGTMVGDPMTGVTVNYGSCLSGTVAVLNLHLMLTGTSPECSWVRVTAHPLSVDDMPDSYDCSGVRAPEDWRGTHIQPPIGPWFHLCPDLAGFGHSGYGCKPTSEPLPVEASTWGSVKALYR